MDQAPRGILIIDLQGGTPGQAVATLRDHGVVVDLKNSPPTAVGFVPMDGRPGLVLCTLPQDVPGLVSAIAQEQTLMLPDTDEGTPPSDILEESQDEDPAEKQAPSKKPAEETETMVVRDPSMTALMHRVEQVAHSNATVLIIGESGTGKELIAEHLHRCSGRDGAFVAINCAGIPDALLESELFGHEKGAFSGATSRRIGKFEAANGGTLLLDEIGEMDLRMQAKVLRAVQQREIDRVGGNRSVPVDVRIVATTNLDLQQLVRLGRFRADLLFRLNVLTLKVPPLRERPTEIPALADFFARKFALANDRSNGVVSPSAMALLLQHTWPGNVRELENVIHRAVLIETGSSISAAALDLEPADQETDEEPVMAPALSLPCSTMPAATDVVLPTAGRTIEAVEKDMILDTLYRSKGNRSQAAAVLGISIRTLRNKLNEYERNGTAIPRPVIIAMS
jgi:DNA-binding NtrC family response regulator